MRNVGFVAFGFSLLTAALGCSHPSAPMAPSSPAAATVADVPLYWDLSQPRPEWPSATEGANLQIRFWQGPGRACVGVQTREQLPPTRNVAQAVYGDVVIVKDGEPSPQTPRRGRQIAQAALAPGHYCLTIQKHSCLVDITVPAVATDAIVVQPVPAPAMRQDLPGIAVEISTGVVRIDVSPPIADGIPPCS